LGTDRQVLARSQADR